MTLFKITPSDLSISRTASILRPKLNNKVGFNYGLSLTKILKKDNEKLRVLLIVPPYTRIVKECEDSVIGKLFEMKRIGIPIGLLRLSKKLKESYYDVKILDCPAEDFNNENILIQEIGLMRYGLDDKEIEKRIKEYNPQVIGIQSIYTHQWGNTKALCDLIKTINKNIVVVIGGHHATGDYKNVLLDSSIDFVVMQEGDITFVELIKALENNLDLKIVQGIAFRTKINNLNAIYLTEPRQFISDLNSIGVLDYSLVNLKLYSKENHSAGKRKRLCGYCVHLFTSVGCNTKCGFCSIPLVNGYLRNLGEELLEKQLLHLQKLNVNELLIEDDNLLQNPFWTLTVCELLKKYNFVWVEEGGVALYALIALHFGNKAKDIIGEKEYNSGPFYFIRKAIEQGITAEQVIKTMAESGCYSVYLAIESANEESLTVSHKPKINALKEITKVIVKLFEQNNIRVTGGFMLGFVGQDYVEKKEGIFKTIEYAKELVNVGMTFANPFIVTPLPGTSLGEYQMKFVKRDYDNGFSHELGTIDPPGSLNEKELEILRWKFLVDVNGKEKVKELLETGTWPV